MENIRTYQRLVVETSNASLPPQKNDNSYALGNSSASRCVFFWMKKLSSFFQNAISGFDLFISEGKRSAFVDISEGRHELFENLDLCLEKKDVVDCLPETSWEN